MLHIIAVMDGVQTHLPAVSVGPQAVVQEDLGLLVPETGRGAPAVDIRRPLLRSPRKGAVRIGRAFHYLRNLQFFFYFFLNIFTFFIFSIFFFRFLFLFCLSRSRSEIVGDYSFRS